MTGKPSYEELEKRIQELEKNEKYYRLLVDNSTDMISKHDPYGTYTYASPAGYHFLGYNFNDLVGRNVYDFFHPDDIEDVKKIFRQTLKSDKTATASYRFKHKKGHYLWLETTSRAIRNPQTGRVEENIAITRDVTERQKLLDALRRSKDRYNLATDAGKVAVWDWNLKTGEVFVSSNLKIMLGYKDQEITKHREDWNRLGYEDDNDIVIRETNACIKGTKREYQVERRMLHKDGSIRWFLSSGRVEKNARGQAVRFVGTDIDITDRKQLEGQLQQSRKMESIGTLAGGIAHEFNNILGIILGNTELAIEDVPEGNPARDSLKEIRTASLRARDVVRKILSFARKSPALRKPIQISTVVKEALVLLKATIPATVDMRSNIYCTTQMILADATEINQVLMNLCANSVFAVGGVPGVLEVNLETVTLNYRVARYKNLHPGDYAKISVKDTGKGIKPDIMDRIFDPYFTTKDVNEGLGMGLAVVHGIIKEHDGAINVTSDIGKGTTVEVFFPLIKAQPSVKEVQSPDALPYGSEHVLFVDDEISLVKVIKQGLESLGYGVDARSNPVEALELFALNPAEFDLVITDMAMPDMTGKKLAEELIKIRPDIPIILCSGFDETMSKKKVDAIGIKEFLMKPVAIMDLSRKIRAIMDEEKCIN